MLDGFLRVTDLCHTMQNEIVPLIKLEDLEDMYKSGGRPPVNPKVLLTVLLMQYIEKLSDRAAAHNLRFRIDWKIALGLELDFEGIHPTTLVKFRDRLLECDKASLAFDAVIGHLVEHGLVKQGASQRIDSTHIVGKVRELSRLELFHETLRLFCTEIDETEIEEAPHYIQELHEYYSDDISIRGISESQKKKYQREAGTAMKAFIDSFEANAEVNNIRSFKTLKTVFEQNFNVDDPDPEGPKPFKIATGKDHISSPHEPETRYGTKGKGKEWIGYKAQFAETVGEGQYNVNFITYADVNESTDFDGDAVEAFKATQVEYKIKPEIVYADTHYNTAKNIDDLSEDGICLMGPVGSSGKTSNPENSGFGIEREQERVICPAGAASVKYSEITDNRVKARFSPEDCGQCSHNQICRPQPRGKQIQLRTENETLKRRREQMETSAFKEEMHKRNGIEGTISGLVRGSGLRTARFRGKSKVRLQIKFSGAAANITRLHRKRVQNEAEKSKCAA